MIKTSQMSAAFDLVRKTENVTNAIRLLAEQARAAGLHDQAQGFDLAADEAGRVGVELDCAARNTFCALRRGEEVPS